MTVSTFPVTLHHYAKGESCTLNFIYFCDLAEGASSRMTTSSLTCHIYCSTLKTSDHSHEQILCASATFGG